MSCANCSNWITARKTLYGNGEEVVNWSAPTGKGACKMLGIDTPAEFSCQGFTVGDEHVEILDRKPGAPWQNWTMIPCPGCSGRGSPPGGANPGETVYVRACTRCAGTGHVRRYDDGFEGDEQTRMHPKEKRGSIFCPNPKCARVIESADWKTCPHCGQKLDAMAATEEIAFGDQAK